MQGTDKVNRRRVLKLSGVALAGSSLVGTASASSSNLEMATLAPTSVTGNDAQFWGEVDNLTSDDYYLSEYYFQYGEAGLINKTTTRNCSDRFSRCPREGDTVDEWVHNLKPDTEYEYRVFGEANDGENDYGSVVAFTTDPGPAIDQLDVTTTTSSGTIEVTVEWAVSHQASGEPDWVQTQLRSGTLATEIEEEDVSGSTASGTHILTADEGDVDNVLFNVWDTDDTRNCEEEAL